MQTDIKAIRNQLPNECNTLMLNNTISCFKWYLEYYTMKYNFGEQKINLEAKLEIRRLSSNLKKYQT